ncbi:hypothetical protein [Clostridium porci]|uniref:hypothetical protein n=1 Tax=Clostridium porci TaxID=2605778 RepID=UPI0012B2ED70|nr:hypothetical protein [Clostridium porci]
MQSEFNQGAAYARDSILSHIIGMQNGLEPTSERYLALQELLEKTEENYGAMMQPYKG